MNNHLPQIKHLIGKHIKGLRIDRGLSQEDLAGLCEVDRSYISMIEVGKNEPSVTKIFQLCEALQINPSNFLRLVEADLKKLSDSE